MSTYTNPYIDPSEIDDAGTTYWNLRSVRVPLAEFNDNIANPFSTEHIARCVRELSKKAAVCYGIDLAKSFDFTVIVGLDEDCNVCHFDRFQKDWAGKRQNTLNDFQRAYVGS